MKPEPFGRRTGEVSRRTFIASAAGVGLGAAIGLRTILDGPDPGPPRISPARPGSLPTDSVLQRAASECPVDTVVVVMMENRSFDHYLGWLADDAAYLEAGRRTHGAGFRIDGQVQQSFIDASGRKVATRAASAYETNEKVETRGCTYKDPGHSWDAGRAQRDAGFLARGSANDDWALAYYTAAELPVFAAMARRFTVFDRWHASLLGPTFPNRQYLLSAQCEGRKVNPNVVTSRNTLAQGVFKAETIFDRLGKAGVPAGYYYTNMPLLALWGDRVGSFIRPLDRFFEDAAAGTLPRVVFLEPFGGDGIYLADDHPWGDVEIGQRWVREVFRAFVSSPHWKSGAFFVTYDEWGGFFDHVSPPVFADDRASSHDADNFGQAGFRVPTLLASPYAMPGGVDHRAYEHTAILRFLEWRFLGAPAQGPGGGQWSLTKRDRSSENMGITLRASQPDPEIAFDLGMRIPAPSPSCSARYPGHPGNPSPDPFDSPELIDLMTKAFPGTSHRPWLADVSPTLG